MTRPWKDPKYKASEKDLDSFLRIKLRQWLTGISLPGPDMQRLLKRMHDFALEVRFEGFSSAQKKLRGDAGEAAPEVHLTELIADALCRGICDNRIYQKSLQETLYLCTGITPKLLQPEFGKRVESFLALSGSKVFIEVFLSVHLSNLIFRDLYDSLTESAPEELRARTEAIEQMCQKVAATAVKPLNDWPDPNFTLVSTLLSDLTGEILRTLSDRAVHRRA
jgi:hypothetical protein